MILLDTSFLAHGVIPNQMTPAAVEAFYAIDRDGEDILTHAAVLLEFTSLLRRLVNRRVMTGEQADDIAQRVLAFPFALVPVGVDDVRAAFALATRLGQSDAFDALGYVLARREEADFLVADRRFANAALQLGLAGVRLVA